MSIKSPYNQTDQSRLSKASPTKGAVSTMTKMVDSALSPVEIFQRLNQQSPMQNSILLESSDIGSKQNLKSIIMLQAAVRIECNGHQVSFTALTHNGENALSSIKCQLQNTDVKIHPEKDSKELIVSYPTQSSFTDEDSRLKQTSPVEALRVTKNAFQLATKSEFSVFLSGLFSYDLIATFEKLPAVESGNNTCPDFVFYLAESLLVIDHQINVKRLYCNHFSGGDNSENTYYELARFIENFETRLTQLTSSQESVQQATDSINSNTLSVDISDIQFQKVVQQLKQNILQGDIFQVVPSRSYSLECNSPIESYKALKVSNPSPYMFYMQDQNFSLFGASPESALKYTQTTNQVELYPIAGTRPRGKQANGKIDLDLDARIEVELKLDKKELSEHMMLVDLARNDIARIAEPGTTHVPKLLDVDRYSQVMHLVSCVKGQLRKDLDALHAYQACMNMGTLTGAPKIKATQLIREVEGKRRGSYGGAVGYLNGQGDMDTCIVIRSAFYQNGIAHVQAGAGVVFDSVPEMEALETENKAKAVITAIQNTNARLGEQTNA